MSIRDPKERFEALCHTGPNGCWLWKSAKRYGTFRIGRGHAIGAHRAAWLLYRGDIPEGMAVCHSCDTPRCVNPAHLFLGSQKVNLADMTQKGRRFRKLTDEQRARVLEPPTLSVRHAKELAAEFGVAHCYLYHIRREQRPSAI